MKGFKTFIFAALLVMFGALQMALPNMQNAIPPEWYGPATMVVGGIVYILRTLTTTPIFRKEGVESSGGFGSLFFVAAPFAMAGLLLLLAVPMPTVAAIKNQDSSFAVTKEEAEEIDREIQRMRLTIQHQGQFIHHLLVQTSAPEKLGCT